MQRAISTSKAPQAIGPYSQAVMTDGFLFLSGQIPLDAETGGMEHDVKKATKLIFENIKEILREGGLTLDDIVKTTVFLTNLDNFAKINEVYETVFKSPYPARSTVQVSRLPKDAAVEIECIAKC